MISYSFLYASVSVLINFMYAFIVTKTLVNAFKLFWDREFYKELLTFSGWTLYSTLSWMFMRMFSRAVVIEIQVQFVDVQFFNFNAKVTRR